MPIGSGRCHRLHFSPHCRRHADCRLWSSLPQTTKTDSFASFATWRWRCLFDQLNAGATGPDRWMLTLRHFSPIISIFAWHIQMVSLIALEGFSSLSWPLKSLRKIMQNRSACPQSISFPFNKDTLRKYCLFWLRLKMWCGKYQHNLAEGDTTISCGCRKSLVNL